jgi:hypothetical protein
MPQSGDAAPLAPFGGTEAAEGVLARFGPATPKPFGAKHQTWPHSVVHVSHDGSLAVRAAEMGGTIRCSWSETFPEGRRRLNRSPPTRCRTHPHPVPSGAAWPVWDSGPILYVRQHRPVNACRKRVVRDPVRRPLCVG